MYLIAALSIIISVLSPFAGLIFIIAVGGKYQEERLNSRFYFALLITILILMVGRVLNLISGLDLGFGILLTSFVFFSIIRQKQNYLRALLLVILINLGYAFFRQVIFGQYISDMIDLGIEQYQELMSVGTSEENLALTNQFLEMFREIMKKYYVGIWVMTISLGTYLGALIYSRKALNPWKHKLFRLPFPVVYGLILVLIMILIPQLRVMGINLMLAFVIIFFIQGFSILDFFLGKYFTKSRFLLYLLFAVLILNPLMLMVGLMGLIDIWFNIRKI